MHLRYDDPTPCVSFLSPAAATASSAPAFPCGVSAPLAFCAFALDGAAYNWSAVDLRSEHQASEALAAAAFTRFALALMIGRLFGDRLVARAGRVRLVQVSAVVAGTGGALVVFGSSAALGLIGWALRMTRSVERQARAGRRGPVMPNSSIKDEKTYQKVRDQGASKEKAARVANAAAGQGRSKVSRRGGKSGSYDDMTKDELYQRAKKVGISGRSSMSRNELVDALRTH